MPSQSGVTAAALQDASRISTAFPQIVHRKMMQIAHLEIDTPLPYPDTSPSYHVTQLPYHNPLQPD
jgi:hypothetical protein